MTESFAVARDHGELMTAIRHRADEWGIFSSDNRDPDGRLALFGALRQSRQLETTPGGFAVNWKA